MSSSPLLQSFFCRCRNIQASFTFWASHQLSPCNFLCMYLFINWTSQYRGCTVPLFRAACMNKDDNPCNKASAKHNFHDVRWDIALHDITLDSVTHYLKLYMGCILLLVVSTEPTCWRYTADWLVLYDSEKKTQRYPFLQYFLHKI